MLPRGEDDGFTSSLGDLKVVSVCIDKLVSRGRFPDFDAILSICGGENGILSWGEASLNLPVFQAAAGKFINLVNPSVLAEALPERSFFVVAQVASVFGICIPLKHARNWQKAAVSEATDFTPDNKKTVCVFTEHYFE